MKKTNLTLIACLFIASLFAQTTGRIENLKDGWGTAFTYVGEIKNKQANGLGVAIYSNKHATRYAGYFLNNQFSGRGAIIFEDGTFLSGTWKNGKLTGKGAYLSKDGDLYLGEFNDGKKEGVGMYVYSDKSILAGALKNDTYEGRCIFINASGTTVADNIYTAGKKNGSGYQYDMNSKTLYEGTWADGTWSSSGTASYASFLKSDKFYSEKTTDQILMGGIDKNNKNLLQDTAFLYNLTNNNRYFGYYDNGFLKNGLIIRDSTVFFGKVNDEGAYGNCSLYKLKKYYDEGNYESDYLDGSNNLSLDLASKTVYFGATDKGNWTGKAWYVNGFNEIYNGNFDKGGFNGPGYIVYNTGKAIRGTYKNDVLTTLTSFTDENGAPIDLKPKSFEAALNLVTSEFPNDFVVFKGVEDPDASVDDYLSARKSIINFPASLGSNLLIEDYDFQIGYSAGFYKGSNFQAAKTQYDKLCRDIATSNIHVKSSTFPIKPTGIVEKATESNTTRTKFTLSDPGLENYSMYAELGYKDGSYTVRLFAGDIKFDD